MTDVNENGRDHHTEQVPGPSSFAKLDELAASMVAIEGSEGEPDQVLFHVAPGEGKFTNATLITGGYNTVLVDPVLRKEFTSNLPPVPATDEHGGTVINLDTAKMVLRGLEKITSRAEEMKSPYISEQMKSPYIQQVKTLEMYLADATNKILHRSPRI